MYNCEGIKNLSNRLNIWKMSGKMFCLCSGTDYSDVTSAPNKEVQMLCSHLTTQLLSVGTFLSQAPLVPNKLHLYSPKIHTYCCFTMKWLWLMWHDFAENYSWTLQLRLVKQYFTNHYMTVLYWRITVWINSRGSHQCWFVFPAGSCFLWENLMNPVGPAGVSAANILAWWPPKCLHPWRIIFEVVAIS